MPRATLLLLLFMVAPVLAQPYRWVDENGQVHYSQVPPTNEKFEQVAPPPSQNASPNQDSINQSLQKSVEDRPQQAADAAEAKRAANEKKSLCENARKQLEFLEAKSAQRMLKTDAQGNVSRASEADLQTRRSEFQRSASENCQ